MESRQRHPLHEPGPECRLFGSGRVVHLQPMTWTSEGWPVIGVDKDGNGVGEPRERKGNVPDLTATFSYSTDGRNWKFLTESPSHSFTGKPGKWIGAKFGFWCNRLAKKNDIGWMQVDWIQVE